MVCFIIIIIIIIIHLYASLYVYRYCPNLSASLQISSCGSFTSQRAGHARISTLI